MKWTCSHELDRNRSFSFGSCSSGIWRTYVSSWREKLEETEATSQCQLYSVLTEQLGIKSKCKQSTELSAGNNTSFHLTNCETSCWYVSYSQGEQCLVMVHCWHTLPPRNLPLLKHLVVLWCRCASVYCLLIPMTVIVVLSSHLNRFSLNIFSSCDVLIELWFGNLWQFLWVTIFFPNRKWDKNVG